MYACILYCLFSDVQSLPSKVVLPWLKAAPKAFASLSGLGGRSTIAGGVLVVRQASASLLPVRWLVRQWLATLLRACGSPSLVIAVSRVAVMQGWQARLVHLRFPLVPLGCKGHQ